MDQNAKAIFPMNGKMLMVSHIAFYLSKIFLSRWLVTTLGMVVLAGLLDSLANADKLPAGSGIAGSFKYMFLRMPIIFDQLFLFALMVAILLTFVSLIRRQELVAILGIGLSVPSQIRVLAPSVFLVSLLSAVIIDQTVPRAVPELANWLGRDKVVQSDEAEPLWINDDGTLVKIGNWSGDELYDLIFFERNEKGTVTDVVWASGAQYDGKNWLLEDVERQSADREETEPSATWQTSQTPQTLAKLGAEPRTLSTWDLINLSSMRGSGSRPSSAYRVWLLHRWTLPLAALSFLIIAAPIMQMVGRRASGDIGLIVGLGIGFLFLIGDGILKTISEAGVVEPWIAIVAPLGTLVMTGLYLWLGREHVR